MHFSEDDLKKIKAFHVATKLPIQLFDKNFNKIKSYYSGISMVIPYTLPKWRQKDIPIQFDYGLLKETFLSLLYKENIIVIGPWLTKTVIDQEITALMRTINAVETSELTHNEYRKFYDALPIYSSGNIRDILILLGFLFNINLEEIYSKILHENVYKNQLQIQNRQKTCLDKALFQEERYFFNYESRILNLIAKGDLALLKKGLANIGKSASLKTIGDSVRTEKNYTIMMMEKIASFAIASGKDILKMINMRNFYIQKIEEKKSLVDVLVVRDSAIIHFTKEMHEIVQSAYSPTVLSVIQIINLMIYDTIRVNEIAERVYLSESRLRKIFKEETGISMSEYINRRKIAASKILLLEGVPAAKVSKQLKFFDLSHYYRMFKKYEGVTPKQFLNTESNKKSFDDIEV